MSRHLLLQELQTNDVPQMPTSVLEKWHERAKNGLKNLQPNEAVQIIETLIDVIL